VIEILGGEPFRIAAGLVLLVFLALACVTDARERRIPNSLVIAIAVGGVAYSIAVAPWLPGVTHALAGVATGLALWLPFVLLHAMGAGDMKFFAAVSAWLGPAASLRAALLAALLGGVLSLVWVARALVARRAGDGGGQTVPVLHERMPYGIAMALGTAITAWLPVAVRGGLQ
jgi:prepilin peptidase CpaA